MSLPTLNSAHLAREAVQPALLLNADLLITAANTSAQALLDSHFEPPFENNFYRYLDPRDYAAFEGLVARLQTGQAESLSVGGLNAQFVFSTAQLSVQRTRVDEVLVTVTASQPAAHPEPERPQPADLISPILQAIEELLYVEDWRSNAAKISVKLAGQLQHHHLEVYEFLFRSGPQPDLKPRLSWKAQIDPSNLAVGESSALVDDPILQALVLTLLHGDFFQGNLHSLPPAERDWLAAQQAQSILLIPILNRTSLWGALRIDDPQERVWYQDELEKMSLYLRAFSAVIFLRRREYTLRQSEERYRKLVEDQGAGMVLTNTEDLVLYANEEADKLFNLAPGELLGHYLSEFTDPAQLEIMRSQTERRKEGQRSRYELEFHLENGQKRTVLISGTPYLNESHVCIGTFGILQDITEQKQSEQRIRALLDAEREHHQRDRKLREATQNLDLTLNFEQVQKSIMSGLQQIIPSNSATLFLYEGLALHISACYGMPEFEYLLNRRVDDENRFFAEAIQTHKSIILADASSHPDFTWWGIGDPPRGWMCVPLYWRDKVLGFLTLDGSEPNCFTEVDANSAEIFANQAASSIQNARLFAETQRLAVTDPLTDLYNRRFLYELGRREFERARRYDHCMSALIIDLDLFKQINDTYGHSVGDQALRTLSDRMQTTLRSTDVLGRYGGDEFFVLLVETNLQEALVIAERLSAQVRNTYIPVNESFLELTTSIGISTMTSDVVNLDDLISRADEALYRAKKAGRNCISA